MKGSIKSILPDITRACFVFYIFFSCNINVFAQAKKDADTTWIERARSNKNVKKLMGIFTRAPEVEKSPFTLNSEAPYLAYEGKIIRKIIIQQVGFDRTLVDTAANLQSFISSTANKLHADTKDFVIRNNLFVREGRPLNPYTLANNERTIRNLDFMMDARIVVRPLLENPDSVDLVVFTRDVFSLGGSVSASLPRKYRVRIQEINLAGMGHRAQFGQAYDHDRTPRYAYEGFYRAHNVRGSFIDASLGYTKLNRGISIGNENERSLYFKLNRDLYQPFARFAGAVELSDNLSKNVYGEGDSTFSQYHYRVQDYWLGYSFAHKKLPKNLRRNRDRTFVSVRSFKQYFLNATNIDLTEPDRFAYRDRQTVLAQLTFFRQDFYKTQYVLGFGRTEDIPHGYRISFNTGWEWELKTRRPYLGFQLDYNKVGRTGTILAYNLKLASYWRDRRPEDDLISFNFTRYSKMIQVRRMILRHQFESGYAILFNQNVKRGLNIRDLNGIVGFMTDSLVGLQRFTISHEATLFTAWKFLGFRIAPTGRLELALIQRTGHLLKVGNFFSGFSLGLRARNENLIFNTIEARLFYYHKTVEGIDHFKVTLNSNFRIRYPSSLVKKPSTLFP